MISLSTVAFETEWNISSWDIKHYWKWKWEEPKKRAKKPENPPTIDCVALCRWRPRPVKAKDKDADELMKGNGIIVSSFKNREWYRFAIVENVAFAQGAPLESF